MKDKIIEILQKEQFNITDEAGNAYNVVEEDDFKDIAERIVKLFAIPVVSGSASCECPQKHLKHINDQNSYPHGEWIEYDQCTQCGKIHNMKVH